MGIYGWEAVETNNFSYNSLYSSASVQWRAVKLKKVYHSLNKIQNKRNNL
jgi:hypothetical protein